MKNRLTQFWPEILLALCILFFAFRELGSFPTIWQDEGLFAMVARSIAEGRGYVLPVLNEEWAFPYILAVGPTVILPVALSIMLFGWSVAAARIPMALYLLLTTYFFYRFTERSTNRWNARWATALLVTLSAFVNTGKPILGEVPGFFFLLLGFLFFFQTTSMRRSALAGLFFGLSVVTKITYGLIFPALAVAWVIALLQKNWREVKQLTLTGFVTGIIFLVWRLIESTGRTGFIAELQKYAFAEGGSDIFFVLREHPEQLFRFQYAYFVTLFVLFLIGMWSMRKTLGPLLMVITTFVVLDVLFFLNGPGWYRHLLLAHLVLLPFVPIGAEKIIGRKLAVALLLFFVIAQTWWQVTYHGSTRITEVDEAVAAALPALQDKDVVILPPEIFVQLPRNPRWLFLDVDLSARDDPQYDSLPLLQEEHCLPELRKLSTAEQAELGDRIQVIHKRYVLVAPPASCL